MAATDELPSSGDSADGLFCCTKVQRTVTLEGTRVSKDCSRVGRRRVRVMAGSGCWTGGRVLREMQQGRVRDASSSCAGLVRLGVPHRRQQSHAASSLGEGAAVTGGSESSRAE